MKPDPFSIRATRFIRSLVNQRDYLLQTGQSKRNPQSFLPDLVFLRTHLQGNSYTNDNQMANFWMRHHEKVFNLMPGVGSPTHNSILISYLELTKEAVTIHLDYIAATYPIDQTQPTINS